MARSCLFSAWVDRRSCGFVRGLAGQKLSKEEAEKLLQQQNADKANLPAKEASKEKNEPKIKETKKNK